MTESPLSWCVVPSAFGFVGVAWSARGVASVAMADTKHEAQSSMRAQIPTRIAQGEMSAPNAWVDSIVSFLSGSLSVVGAVPVDTKGTVFEEKIWAAIGRIPTGTTLSYAELAQQACGGARHARAVARACAHNPCALLVPCHRVTSSTGASPGFRWGVERKIALLAAERQATE